MIGDTAISKKYKETADIQNYWTDATRRYIQDVIAGIVHQKVQEWIQTVDHEFERELAQKIVSSEEAESHVQVALEVLRGAFADEQPNIANWDSERQKNVARNSIFNAITLQHDPPRFDDPYDIEKGLIGAKKLAEMLSREPNTISRNYSDGKLLGFKRIEGKTTKRLYPRWQVFNGKVLRGIGQLKAVFADDVRAMRFLLRPHDALNQERPLDLLKKASVGEMEPLETVLSLAQEEAKFGA